MLGIPVLTAEGDCIARAWENALVKLHQCGCNIQTQYDKPSDPPSKDATMVLTVADPLAEPMIHRDFPGGFEELEEYVMEVCDGIKDHCVRDPSDPTDTRWEYTYHQRLFGYTPPGQPPVDQIEHVCRQLAKTPHTRRAQAITWKVWEDNTCYDPPCLQSVWCRIIEESGEAVLEHERTVPLERRLQGRVHEHLRPGSTASDGLRHGSAISRAAACGWAATATWPTVSTFTARTLRNSRPVSSARSSKRSFEERTMRYEDLREWMEEARPKILEKARNMGR